MGEMLRTSDNCNYLGRKIARSKACDRKVRGRRNIVAFDDASVVSLQCRIKFGNEGWVIGCNLIPDVLEFQDRLPIRF